MILPKTREYQKQHLFPPTLFEKMNGRIFPDARMPALLKSIQMNYARATCVLHPDNLS